MDMAYKIQQQEVPMVILARIQPVRMDGVDMILMVDLPLCRMPRMYGGFMIHHTVDLSWDGVRVVLVSTVV
jgi:hypothetical protein